MNSNLGYSIVHNKQYFFLGSNRDLFFLMIFILFLRFIIKTIILRQLDVTDLIVNCLNLFH